YVLPDDSDAGLGSMVSVKFHGRTVKGWILGATEEPPTGRLLPVTRVRSPIRFFDEQQLRLLRWVGERYVTPLCVVIERSFPPRVAGEEKHLSQSALDGDVVRHEGGGGLQRNEKDVFLGDRPAQSGETTRSWDGDEMGQLLAPGTTSWYRPLPDDEGGAAVRAGASTLQGGERAIVLVPGAGPVPATATAGAEPLAD